MRRCNWIAAVLLVAAAAVGCNSPYRADRGALFGGLTGAGVGAIVGNAVGAPGAGAAIGAGVGAVTGGAVGGALDDIEARNRAEIEARMGRPVGPGAVTTQDVIAMSRAGVAEENIVTHIRSHGMAAPLQSNDLIFLSQQDVSARVIETMQMPPQMAAQPTIVRGASPPPMIVEEIHYGPPPYWGPPPCYYPPRRGVQWGVSVGR